MKYAEFSPDTFVREHTPELEFPGEERFPNEEGFYRSRDYMLRYLNEHVSEKLGLDCIKSALMTAGTLEWLLQRTRPSLSGKFREADLVMLLNCYQGKLIHPDQLPHIAEGVCYDNDIELDEVDTSGIADLVNTILALDHLQQLVLADLLWQTWNRGFVEGKSVSEFATELGVELAP